jgi:hypothetical protein
MSKQELDNLVRINRLKAEPASRSEGRMEIDEGLLADLIRCTKKLETAAAKLSPPDGE